MPRSQGINVKGLRQLADGLTQMVSTALPEESRENRRNRQFRLRIADRLGSTGRIERAASNR